MLIILLYLYFIYNQIIHDAYCSKAIWTPLVLDAGFHVYIKWLFKLVNYSDKFFAHLMFLFP